MLLNRLRGLWGVLRSSLWFVPALIVAGSVALAVVLVDVDWLEREELVTRFPRLFGAGADGSRGLLTAIAGSMITVVGVTFSITVVTLALTSSQYTSRVLQNFMRDRGNQAVLGVFAGVFAYCLVVLRTIRGGEDGTFVPALAVLAAVLLSFVAIGFLIFFIHHVATSIQAGSIIAAAAAETLRAIDHLFPAELGHGTDEPVAAGRPDGEPRWTAIPARRTGYIQDVDGDALFEVARASGAVVRMERGVGDFLIEEAPLAWLSAPSVKASTIEQLNAAFTVGQDRSVHQDAGYGIRQIVDIALRALSPGINDTTTAVNCIDFLGAILARLAARRVETPYRTDGGTLRLITRGPTFAGLLAESFDQIRQNAERNPAVMIRVLEVLRLVRARTSDPGRRRAIEQQAELVAETARRGLACSYDLASVLRAVADEDAAPALAARSAAGGSAAATSRPR